MKTNNFIFVLIAGLFVVFTNTQSQEKIPNKQFYAELFGPGIVSSINFDSRFKSDTNRGFGYRVGVGFSIADFEEKNYSYDSDGTIYLDHTSYYRSYATIPLGLNYVFGKKHSVSAFEVGAGATILTRTMAIFYYDRPKSGNFIGHLSFLYRRTPSETGFAWRIGFTPIIGTSGDIFPFGTVGIGYAF